MQKLTTSSGQPENESLRPAFQEILECPLCGSKKNLIIHREFSTFRSGGAYFNPYRNSEIPLKSCTQCGFAFTGKLPTAPDFYEKLYSRIQVDWNQEFNFHGKKKINADIRKLILEANKQNGKLLDIGSWAGALLHSLRDLFEVQGIEINSNAANCSIQNSIPVQNSAFLKSQLLPNEFDVITIVDVLEHLSEPGQILKRCHELLKNDGLLYVKVPNYKAQLWKQRLLNKLGLSKEGILGDFVHINHFSPDSLSKYLENNGFDVLQLHYTRAEIWDLSMPNVPLKSYIQRLFRNISGTSVTYFLNTFAQITGIQSGLNFGVLVKKRS